MIGYILTFVSGMVFGVLCLTCWCCCMVAKDPKPPKDKEEWRELD